MEIHECRFDDAKVILMQGVMFGLENDSHRMI